MPEAMYVCRGDMSAAVCVTDGSEEAMHVYRCADSLAWPGTLGAYPRQSAPSFPRV